MLYSNVCRGVFLSRPNRFIARVLVNGIEETVHVKNTGRCKELLVKGCTVYLEKSSNPLRKTLYDCIAVKKGDRIFNIDSVAPNTVGYEYFYSPSLKRERVYKSSRFDLFDEETNTFTEIKGVTLEKDGIAMFPDAPTERGRKHILELIDAKRNGYNARIIFIIQFEGAKKFIPNYITDKKFRDALIEAQKNGVEIEAYGCSVTPKKLTVKDRIEVCLDQFLPI